MEACQKKPRCRRDTNGDGDCHICKKSGCPLQFFAGNLREILTLDQQAQDEFIKNATPFSYSEGMNNGVIRGFRDKQGRVLITECNLIVE